ncbi:DUF4153 domain-containing protein [Roseovarius sp. LXJ103]|uniref:DUF4153 domain-containing protein n=1 Tax=Roseovarius carneus TaxID=2853164 RepID=UPI000D61C4AF|nr:DUF4153 domain-containing protein [Roseovarius carneus]MBZ8117171.1 DUF4153 domain-containing protein [Roseovarius carneus]PWE36989.1 hypothetical protein DD563_14175 [Pelagicola sp. LXJ1103]
MSQEMQSVATRLSLAAIGALSGLAVWGMAEVLPDLVDNTRALVFLLTLGFVFFGVLLALIGPERPVPASLGAAGLAVPSAALFLWASYRFENMDAFFDHSEGLLALGAGLFIAVPFVAAGMATQGGWRDYARLFDTSWNIVVRYAAAWLFAGVAWGVAMASDALLGLVGVHVIETLIEIEVVPYIFTGLVLGLGLAIVHELSDYISPFLLIQLFRVLVPVVLVVVVVFIVALPLRGLGDLFGQFSVATMMAGVAIASITLITTAIGRDDEMSAQGAGMLFATQALSILITVPAALALYAVWLRVDQYGLTPQRVAAMLGAFVVLSYALAFAVSVAMRGDWRGRIRAVNRYKAMAVVTLAALWMTPVINAERMSTASQVARAEAGLPPEELALWEMAHDWGKPGRRGLDRVAGFAEASGNTELAARIDSARTAANSWEFSQTVQAEDVPMLDGTVPLRPAGAVLPEGAFGRLSAFEQRSIDAACKRSLLGGFPGCVLVIAGFEPLTPVQGVIGLYYQGGDIVQVTAYELHEGALMRIGRVITADGLSPRLGRAEMMQILEGDFQIIPVPRNVLDLGEMQIFPRN